VNLLDIFVLLLGAALGYFFTSHFFATGQAA
jgi:hypothetical protein